MLTDFLFSFPIQDTDFFHVCGNYYFGPKISQRGSLLRANGNDQNWQAARLKRQ